MPTRPVRTAPTRFGVWAAEVAGFDSVLLAQRFEI
jgi:hypothetical protein